MKNEASRIKEASNPRTNGAVLILCLFGLGVSLTELLQITGLDLGISSYFFDIRPDDGGWAWGRFGVWAALYEYGNAPGIFLGIASLTAYAWARNKERLSAYRKPCLVMLFTVLLGPGLIVNGLLKPGWGRARPADTAECGGTERYGTVWEPGGPGRGKSFPCGHCSMAFALTSLGALHPIHPFIATAGTAVGVVYGGIMGIARVAQGGHFATDVIWSGVIVVSIAAWLYYFLFRVPEDRPPAPRS
ncbi:MAG: phosphatase PAP2 family protein [Pseudomonadota bacterium]